MIETKILSRSRLPVIIAVISITYVCWQLIGIRFENSDDIYLHLHSQILSDNYFTFALDTANGQARIQAYLNMPIVLWANSFQETFWFDVINISVFAFLYASFIYFLTKLMEKKDAFVVASFTAIEGHPLIRPTDGENF